MPGTRKGCPYILVIRRWVQIGCRFTSDALGGGFDGLVDFGVAGAAAEVSGEGFFYLVASGPGVSFEKGGAREEHAGGAVAALGGAEFCEGLLEGMQLPIVLQAFDGGDFAVLYLDGQCKARKFGGSIYEHGAGATFSQFAAMLGANQPHIFTQDFE
jgi:hypothetical protein